MPRRVYSLSHVKYAVDRITWLYENRHLIGGLKSGSQRPEDITSGLFCASGSTTDVGGQAPLKAPLRYQKIINSHTAHTNI